MKPEHEAFIREAAEITTLFERLTDLLEEYGAAPCEQTPALQAEILEIKERIIRFSLHYQN